MGAIGHAKSDTVGDFANTVTVFNSQGSTVTAAATDLVRPGDWNSAHNFSVSISTAGGGSSAGTSNVSGTNLVYGFKDGLYGSNSTAAGGGMTMWMGNIPNSAFQPVAWITGSAWSSHNSSLTYFKPFTVIEPVVISQVVVPKSVSIGIPAGTSSNTQQSFRDGYTHFVSLFKRKDYGANSNTLTLVTYGSFVQTFSFTHNSTSMGLSCSWNTDSAGGTSAQNTTSNATANLASVYSGNRMVSIPFPLTTLSEGEYWLAQAHSSSQASTAGTGSTIGRFSNMHLVPQVGVNMAPWGASSATNSSLNPFYPAFWGIASAVTTNGDMNASVISGGTIQDWWVVFKGW